MSLLLDAPPASTAKTRAGRSWLPVLAALLGVTGLLASAWLQVPRAASFPQITPAAEGAPFVTVPEFGARGAHILGYQHHARVTLTVPVRNDGWLPVSIRSFDLDAGPAPLLLLSATEGLPLSLGPGESGSFTVRGVLTNCRYFHMRALQTFDGAQLGFSALGRSATRTVRFDRPLLVKSPMLASCPDRRIARGADSRGALPQT
jgi:hypothetical protein